MKRLLFIHSTFIHSGTVLSDELPKFHWAYILVGKEDKEQTRTSDGTDAPQIIETECREKGTAWPVYTEWPRKATLRRWHLRWDPNDKMEPVKQRPEVFQAEEIL